MFGQLSSEESDSVFVRIVTIAGIPGPIVIRIGLIRIGRIGAVVLVVGNPIAIGIDIARILRCRSFPDAVLHVAIAPSPPGNPIVRTGLCRVVVQEIIARLGGDRPIAAQYVHTPCVPVTRIMDGRIPGLLTVGVRFPVGVDGLFGIIPFGHDHVDHRVIGPVVITIAKVDQDDFSSIAALHPVHLAVGGEAGLEGRVLWVTLVVFQIHCVWIGRAEEQFAVFSFKKRFDLRTPEVAVAIDRRDRCAAVAVRGVVGQTQLRQVALALSRTGTRTDRGDTEGKSRAIKTTITPITIKSSISVKPRGVNGNFRIEFRPFSPCKALEQDHLATESNHPSRAGQTAIILRSLLPIQHVPLARAQIKIISISWQLLLQCTIRAFAFGIELLDATFFFLPVHKSWSSEDRE